MVVDASVLAPALADDGPTGVAARRRLAEGPLTAPEVIDLEVLSVLRRSVRGGALDLGRAELALASLLELPVQRASHAPLLARCWELRGNVTAYDAAYVALAELLDTTLVTADARLARAPGLRCAVDLLA